MQNGFLKHRLIFMFWERLHKIIGTILSSLLSLILPVCCIGFYTPAVEVLAKTIEAKTEFWYFCLGTMLSASLVIYFHKKFDILSGFWTTLEHELTHALIGLPFGVLPRKIVATRKEGGYVAGIPVPLLGPVSLIGTPFIALGPYYFPFLSFLTIVFQWVSGITFPSFILGFIFSYDFISKLLESYQAILTESFGKHTLIGDGYSDFGIVGKINAILLVPQLMVLCFTAVLAFAVGRQDLMIDFFREGFQNSFAFAKDLYPKVVNFGYDLWIWLITPQG